MRRLSPDEPFDTYSIEELELVAQLGKEREQSADVLNHTFGAYLAQRRQVGLSLEVAAGRIQDIGVNLVKEHNMPEWLPTAAMKGGIDLLTCWRLWCSGCDCGRSLEEFETANVKDCLSMLIKVIERMPPKDIRKILPENVRRMNTVLDRMLHRIGDDEYAIHWKAPDDWVELWQELGNLIWMYMNGSTYADMASVFLGIERNAIEGKRSQGQKPIPAIFSFVGRVLHHLSIYAGALLVVLEESEFLHGQLGDLPSLPLCIRNGCSGRDSLAWFRYGYRNRMAAHEFAKKFPVPEEIQDEDVIKRWITQQRREWLREDASGAESEVLRSIRMILSS